MLFLLLILSGLGRLTSTGHHSETSHLQITVPQKLKANSNEADASETHVTYAIKIDKTTYTIHLEKQSLLDPHFLMYLYNKSGTLYPDSSFMKGHCFYQGYAAEIPKSVVTLSTCSGLRGLLQLENVSYGIEPLEYAATYDHMLYEIKNNKIDFFPLQGNYPTIQMANQPYNILVKPEKKSEVVLLERTLKIQIIMDKALYDYMGSEVAIAAEKVVHIFGLINTMFSQLNISFVLTSLELWSDQNKILFNGDANEVLQRFVSWKEKFLSQRSHDMAFLLIYRNYPNYVGATYHGMACDPKLAAGIALYPKRITLEAFSVVMAQLLGINLGLTYDDIYNCYCPGITCIMSPQAIHSCGVKHFSSCSVDVFKHMVSQPELKCLQNQTVLKLDVQGRDSTCGNGIVESGEQCDCGPPETCEFKKCCDPNTCTLIGLAECGTGPCCDKKSCVLFERGHICRESVDPCDFTEFCNGLSELCMTDVKSADLEPCNNKTTFCYGGICRDPDQHCFSLFGKYAKAADFLCQQEVNMQEDEFGNCKSRCWLPNIHCGKRICHWTNTRVLQTVQFNVQYTFRGGHVCISGYKRYPSGVDNTYVPDGTMCDHQKFCQGNVCKPVSDFANQHCNATAKCKGHGVCNTKHNCQCDVGYTPPFCEYSESSPGGSIDDGFWILTEGKIVNSPKKRLRAARQKHGFLISFFIFLPFFILIAIIALKQNIIKFWERERTVSEGFTSEESSSNSNNSYTELEVTYAIKIDKTTYTIHLEKQSLLDPHFLVYLYNKSGTLYPDSSFIKGHCFYQGYAAEIPKSVVILSTCSGLRGLLQLENVSYGIEPLESATTYEHMLYEIKNNKINFFPLQENYPTIQMANQPHKILVKSEKKSEVVLLERTLKIQIIMDKALYDYMGSEVAIAAEKVVHIFGLINTMFSQLNISFVLTSLELWSDQNKILFNGDANEVLQRFVSWKEKFLSQRSHDMAFLLIYRNYPNYVGATYHGMACDPKLAAGIALYPKRITLETFSVVMAQLLGINLGLTYDDIYNCYCPGITCIMSPQAIHYSGVKFFSSCSMDEFKHIVSQPELKCLQNQTVSKLVVQGRDSTCGNGIVESGEQCDCGPPETCTFKKCCNPSTCTLIGYAECGTGPCCDSKSCQIFQRGRVCRRSKDPCDFAEFCSGFSEFCVPDVKAADLEPCNNKTTYCYGGICQDTDKHFAKGADYVCLQEVNIQADVFGNCGKPCDFRNTNCGKTVCHWTHSSIIKVTTFDMQYTYAGSHVCISANMRQASAVDKTYVPDGTACGERKFCHQKICRYLSDFPNAHCNATEKCQGHGVCNTKHNCQCDVGYAPPYCEIALSSPGGSLDDGFWIFTEEKTVISPKEKTHAHPQKHGLLISLCIFLTFLILIAIIALKQNIIKFWEREKTVSEGSTSEESSNNSSKSYTEL